MCEFDDQESKPVVEYQSYQDLIEVLHRVHCDNSKNEYFARKPSDKSFRSIMPLTPFVFEFFLYNSIYQYDWELTTTSKELTLHSEAFNEPKKQRSLLTFIKKRLEGQQEFQVFLVRAFKPLLLMDIPDDGWTTINPDSQIKEDDGKKFFKDIRQIQTMIKEGSVPVHRKAFFTMLRECVIFVYKVRNNIFHGTKNLQMISEENQKKRIDVYNLLLKGVTSLFFLLTGRTTTGAEIILDPRYCSLLPYALLPWHRLLIRSGFKAREQGNMIFIDEADDKMSSLQKILDHGQYGHLEGGQFIPKSDQIDEKAWIDSVNACQDSVQNGGNRDIPHLYGYMAGIVRWLSEAGLSIGNVSLSDHSEIVVETSSEIEAEISSWVLKGYTNQLIIKTQRRNLRFIIRQGRPEIQPKLQKMLDIGEWLHKNLELLKPMVEKMREMKSDPTISG